MLSSLVHLCYRLLELQVLLQAGQPVFLAFCCNQGNHQSLLLLMILALAAHQSFHTQLHILKSYTQHFFSISFTYRKIPKISPGAYIFQRPFMRGSFLEGLIFRGAYVQREICVSTSIGLACSGKEIYHFCFVLLCIWGQIPCTSPPGGLYSEGRFNGGFFAIQFWGAYIWRGLYMEGLIFGILQ